MLFVVNHLTYINMALALICILCVIVAIFLYIYKSLYAIPVFFGIGAFLNFSPILMTASDAAIRASVHTQCEVNYLKSFNGAVRYSDLVDMKDHCQSDETKRHQLSVI